MAPSLVSERVGGASSGSPPGRGRAPGSGGGRASGRGRGWGLRRAGQHSASRRRGDRRRWPRRLLLGANAVVLLCLVVAGGGYGYLRFRLSQIRQVTVPNLVPPAVTPQRQGGGGGSAGGPVPAAGPPETFLLVGSDTRAGDTAAQAAQFGSAKLVGGQRSDVIILLRVDPASARAAMLSIPRDTFVPIAGTGGSDKINAAFNKGPGQLVQTIAQDFHIPISHYLEVDFSGLMGLVNTVGGVCMHFPYPVRDGAPPGSPPGSNESGLREPAGNDVLNGTQALSLVRSRYYQYERDGYWHPDGLGDISRIDRQHQFLRALADKAIHDGIRNPLTANALLSQAVHDVTRDSGLTTGDMLHLIGALRSLRPSAVPSWTLPTRAVNNYPGHGDVLMPEPAQDAAVIAAWEGFGAAAGGSGAGSGSGSGSTGSGSAGPGSGSGSSGSGSSGSGSSGSGPAASALLPPGSVTVDVLNGSGTAGQAGQAADALRAAGFNVGTVADAASYDHATTTVSYGPGGAEAAATVAAYVDGGAVAQPAGEGQGRATVQGQGSATVQGGAGGDTVVLTTGTSFGGISATPQTQARAAPANANGAGAGTSGTAGATGTGTGAGAAASGSAAAQGAGAHQGTSGPTYPWDPTPC